MTIVTGDRYLDLLSTFTEENTGLLLDGVLLLKLNPVGLHYVQTRLEALEELEALLVGAPVDYLRAYVADLGDHRALEQLRRVLGLLNSVKVVATVQAPARDPTPITLLPFSRLRFLELRGCDLSTSAARGLLELRPILEKLVCYNSADALRHIFSERTKEIQGAPVWSRLADVSCFGNGMLLMDESLQLLPAVEALDLSRNRFAKLANLQKCSRLKYLDAGFNNITTVAKLNKILPCVTKLVLRNNAVVSTKGLHRIASLEALDLSYNLISNFREVESLGQLPSLRLLWLQGNPISFGRTYRAEALSYFPEPMKVVLDGKPTSMWESFVAGRLVARRLRQRSKYGAFIAAEIVESSDFSPQLSGSEKVDDAPSRVENSNGAGPSSSASPSAIRARKKNSRLAAITDFTGSNETLRRLESPRECSFNSLPSLDPASLMQSGVVESKEQIEETVQDLIQRAEVLKKAGSNCWLRDLNALLESEGKNKSHVLEKNDSSQQISWQKRRRRRSIRKGASLGDAHGSEKSIEGLEEANPARFTKDSSARRTIKDASFESSYDGKALSASSSLDDLQGSFVDGNEQLPTPPPIPNDLYDGGGHKLIDTSEKFRLTEDLVTGKMLASASSSPPQFNQAVLRRRQTLERELLLLPPERDDLSPVVDSDTSSGTIYSHLSDSSDSPLHSPSSVWNPYRFDHSHEGEPSSAPGGRSDSDGASQVWSDTEAQEGEALARSARDGPDVKGLTEVVHTGNSAESSGEGSAPAANPAEGKELAAEDSIPPVHSSESTDAAADDLSLSVQPPESKETGEGGTTAAVHHVEEGKEAVGEDAAVVSDNREEKEEAVSRRLASSSSSSLLDCDLISKGNNANNGDNGHGKENRGTHEGQLSLRSSRTTSQSKSRSSRRIVQLESSAGVPEGSGWTIPPAREGRDSWSERHRAGSLGGKRGSGQGLERSRSSSAQYSNPFTLTRSASAEASLEKREWARGRSQEDAFASTSLQQGESHEAADSNMQFHRVHHTVGSFVGQCA